MPFLWSLTYNGSVLGLVLSRCPINLRNLYSLPLHHHLLIPIENMGEYQGNLARMKSERDAWKEKYNMSEYENRVLARQLKEKEDLLFIQDGWFIDHDEKLRQKDALLKKYASERKRKKEDSVSVALVPNPQKEIIDRLVAEKKEMEDFYEEKIRKLQLQLAFGPSSDDSE